MSVSVANGSTVTTRRMSLAAVAAMSLGLMAAAAQAAPYISLDFQSDTVDAPPSGTAYYNGVGTVVNNDSTPFADPFGPAGNQSLLLKDDSTSAATTFTFMGAAGGLTEGNFSIDFYQAGTNNTNTPPYAEIWLAQTEGYGQWARGAVIQLSNGSLSARRGDSTNTVAGYTLDQKHTLTLSFNSLDKKFSGTLDGVDLAYGAQTEFDYAIYSGINTAGPIDTVVLVSGWSGAINSYVFFDNATLSAVPEPASLSLLALGALGLMRRSRRR